MIDQDDILKQYQKALDLANTILENVDQFHTIVEEMTPEHRDKFVEENIDLVIELDRNISLGIAAHKNLESVPAASLKKNQL
jgi:hypothetical protein